MTHSNGTSQSPEYKKPRPDFPLSIHKGTGYWSKKIRGRVFYFGKIADDLEGIAAESQWNREKDDLLAGREPREKTDEFLTLETLCFRFLEQKESDRDQGELSPRTYQGYLAACERMAKILGRHRSVDDLLHEDFRKLKNVLSDKLSSATLRVEMQRIRMVFKFAYDAELVDKPIRAATGHAFKRPSLKITKKDRKDHQRQHGLRMFSADEILLILKEADTTMKAAVLLGINCGFGQSDVANLPISALDLKRGWLDFPRVKTGEDRRVPLWPETGEALKVVLANRPKSRDDEDSDLVFLTSKGKRWHRVSDKGVAYDFLGITFARLLRRLNIKRPKLSFYGLRHGVETIGGEMADQVAVDAVMGHSPQGMAAAYREDISDERLKRVTDHIRAWLFNSDESPEGEGSKPEAATVAISPHCAPRHWSRSGWEVGP
ncbi:MAG: tyrosine-type recombinase/integrase, partial [Planctomycetaceae bacterium]